MDDTDIEKSIKFSARIKGAIAVARGFLLKIPAGDEAEANFISQAVVATILLSQLRSSGVKIELKDKDGATVEIKDVNGNIQDIWKVLLGE